MLKKNNVRRVPLHWLFRHWLPRGLELALGPEQGNQSREGSRGCVGSSLLVKSHIVEEGFQVHLFLRTNV